MTASNRELWQGHLFGTPRLLAPTRRNRHIEQGVLNAVLKYLSLHPKVAWAKHINSGGFKDKRGQFVRFGFVGCPDVIGQMKNGSWLAIEVKAPEGRLTDDQEFWLAKIRANGGFTGVARSIEDALAIVEGK